MVTETLSIARLLVPDREQTKHDYPRQRMFYGPRFIAHRPPGSSKLEFREEVLKLFIPGYVLEMLKEAMESAEQEREAKRGQVSERVWG